MAQTVRGPEDAAVAEIPADAAVVVTNIAEERVSVASQWQLMWWRFRKHKLAMVAAVVVIFFYLGIIVADFLAYADPEVSDAQRGLIGRGDADAAHYVRDYRRMVRRLMADHPLDEAYIYAAAGVR